MHEATLYEDSRFVTMTYDDEHLPAGGTLRPEDFVGFMKRLRWRYGEGIRYFQCGEYGEQFGRPHHHALLFNLRFKDEKRFKEEDGITLFTSDELDELWGFGQCTIGEVTFETAAYIARYTLKKVVGPAAEAHYGARVPEYLTMSRRPGLGCGYVERWRGEIYRSGRSDAVISRGRLMRPPRYYDESVRKTAPSVIARVKMRRRKEAEQDPERGKRLWEKEAVKEEAIKHLTRAIEVNQ